MLKSIDIVALIIFRDLEPFPQAYNPSLPRQIRNWGNSARNPASRRRTAFNSQSCLIRSELAPAGALVASWLSMNSVAIETTVPAGSSNLASSTWCMYSVVAPCRWVRQSSQCREPNTR